jgi:hypothetical protein
MAATLYLAHSQLQSVVEAVEFIMDQRVLMVLVEVLAVVLVGMPVE